MGLVVSKIAAILASNGSQVYVAHIFLGFARSLHRNTRTTFAIEVLVQHRKRKQENDGKKILASAGTRDGKKKRKEGKNSEVPTNNKSEQQAENETHNHLVHLSASPLSSHIPSRPLFRRDMFGKQWTQRIGLGTSPALASAMNIE